MSRTDHPPSPSAPHFYQTGGTLGPTAPSYVERQADRDLYEALTRGDFCYVLTARQMGKSSLMVRTTQRLRQEGVAVAGLDLTALGQNLSPEQWYEGLLGFLGRHLDLEDELDDFWVDHERTAPLQRFMAALHQVVLGRVPGRVVIFVDEIDAVRSLPFSTDEFFAAIRACYNRRTEDPEFERLTFCLLGVATPSDLIQDVRTTPFNIGRRIELTDFTEAEASLLTEGLGSGEATRKSLLQRILYWTGGHPYLTQRLCQTIAEEGNVIGATAVDRVCQELFLSSRARERDDNLLFVGNWLLRSDADRASLLDLYGRMGAGKRVADDEKNSLIGVLRLSGVVRASGGLLQVRNRIYGKVFDRAWVQANMPNAELQRQRAAFRHGLWRASGVAVAILTVILGLALEAWNQARLANQQRRLAQERERTARHYLYGSQMNLAEQAWEAGNVRRASELLESQRPGPLQEDLRGFEWRYLWRLCQGEALATLRDTTGYVFSVAFSPDGRTLATGTQNGAVTLWDSDAARVIGNLTGHTTAVQSLAFAPNGRILASGSTDRSVKLWNITARQEVATLAGHTDRITSLAFSQDGDRLATANQDGTVHLWEISPLYGPDLAAPRELAVLTGARAGIQAVTFANAGKILATYSGDGQLTRWKLGTRQRIASFRATSGETRSAAFSSDGALLAVGNNNNSVGLWKAATGQRVATLRGHTALIRSINFSPDGKTLATGSDDTTLKLWDVAGRTEIGSRRGHRDGILCVAFSPDGKKLASGSTDLTLKLWARSPQQDHSGLAQHSGWITSVAFSPKSDFLATGDTHGTINLWAVTARRVEAVLPQQKSGIDWLAFSTDGQILAAVLRDQTAVLWDIPSRRPVLSLPNVIGPVNFAIDSRAVTLPRGDGSLALWDLRSKELRAIPHRTRGFTRAVAFSPDGRILALGTKGAVVLWDPSTQRVFGRLRGDPVEIRSVGFSHDERMLAAVDEDRTVLIWDLNTRQASVIRNRSEGSPVKVLFAPDDRSLALVDGTSTVRVWSIAAKQEVATLKGHLGPVVTAGFSPDGNTLATAGADRTVRLWHAASFQESDPLQVIGSASDRTVRLQWKPLRGIMGYNLYRGQAEPHGTPLVKLNPVPILGTSFTDRSPALVNGEPQAYLLAPLLPGTGGVRVEGPKVMLQATPVAAPPGWMGCSINENRRSGSVSFNASTGEMAIRGSGEDIWAEADSFYFLNRPVAGDFQMTATMVTRPTATNLWAKAGLMLRDSLDADARNAFIFTNQAYGLNFQWRSTPNAETLFSLPSAIESAQLTPPVTLRLTRQRDSVFHEYSTDAGRNFRPIGEPLQFTEALPETTYAGIAITAHDPDKISEARFRDLEIRTH